MQWKQPFLYINWASGFWQENKEKREDVNSGQFNLCYFCYFCMGRPGGWPRPDGHGGWPNACGWVWPRPAGHGPCGWRVWPRCLHCAPSLLQTWQCKQQCMHKQLVWRSRGFSSRLLTPPATSQVLKACCRTLGTSWQSWGVRDMERHTCLVKRRCRNRTGL